MTYITVTTDNLTAARAACVAIDQRSELKVGCATWSIAYEGGQRGQMTVWPEEGRGAVMWGASSQWGDWDATTRTLRLDSGEIVNEDGDVVSDEAGGAGYAPHLPAVEPQEVTP